MRLRCCSPVESDVTAFRASFVISYTCAAQKRAVAGVSFLLAAQATCKGGGGQLTGRPTMVPSMYQRRYSSGAQSTPNVWKFEKKSAVMSLTAEMLFCKSLPWNEFFSVLNLVFDPACSQRRVGRIIHRLLA